MKLKVDPEIEALFGQLESEIRKLLKEDIKQRGVRVKGVVADPPFEGIIVQGHTRYKICQELGIEFPYEVRHYNTREELMKDAVQDNLLRRHLNTAQRADLARRYLLPIEKKKAKERKEKGGIIGAETRKKEPLPKILGKGVPTEEKGTAMDKAAEAVGLSGETLRKVNKVMEKGEDKLKQRMLKGEIKVDSAYKSITKPKKNKEYDWIEGIEGTCSECGKVLWVLHSDTKGHKVVEKEEYKKRSFGRNRVTLKEID